MKSKILAKINSKNARIYTLITGIVFICFLIATFFLRSLGNALPTDEPLSFGYGQTIELEIFSDEDSQTLEKKAFLRVVNGPVVDAEIKFQDTSVNNLKKVAITPAQNSPPGKYSLIIPGIGSELIEQDFTWGVLAINTHKSVYSPGETAEIALAVLDEQGGMVCDAEVLLQIVDPAGNITNLSTGNNRLKANPECEIKEEPVDKDDYEASYKTNSEGEYTLYVTANTHNGEYVIKDKFFVEKNIPFDVIRDTRTRIYPPRDYPVSIEIHARQDFSGTITEQVPHNFKIIKNPSVKNPDEIVEKDDFKLLIWNAKLKSGEKLSIGYTYDAPDVSPYFDTIGELVFTQNQSEIFREYRKFHIAFDAISSVRPNGDNTVTGWSAATGSNLYAMIDDDPDSSTDASDYINGPNRTDGSAFFELTDMPSGFIEATNIDIKAKHMDFTSGQSGGNDTITVYYQIFESDGSTAITAETAGTVLSTSYTTDNYTSISITGTNTEASWNGALLRVRQVHSQSNGPDTENYARITAVEVNMTYDVSILNQDAYIFENDDGSTVNGNSDMASANTEVSVRKGQRFIARIQLANEAASQSTYTWGIQYDKMDDNWNYLSFGGAPDTNDAASNRWDSESISAGTQDAINSSLGFPQFIGGDGSGAIVTTTCLDANCTNYVTNEYDTGASTVSESVAAITRPNGLPGVFMAGGTGISNEDVLMFIDCQDLFCSDASTTTLGSSLNTIVGVDAINNDNGFPLLFYGQVGNINTIACNDIACSGANETSTAHTVADAKASFSAALGSDGFGALAYQDSTNSDLEFFHCSNTNCTSSTVNSLASTNDVGNHADMAIGTDGYPVISHVDDTNDDIYVVKCNDVACSGSDETSTVVYDFSATSNIYNSKITIGRDGMPVVSIFEDSTNESIYLVYCKSTDCDDDNNTETVYSGITSGALRTVLMDQTGYPIIVTSDAATSTNIYRFRPKSEISLSSALSGADGDTLTAQAAGACQTTSSANGKFYENRAESDSTSINADTCMEVAFPVHTEFAQPGNKYRLRIVDGSGNPIPKYDTYPTFTVLDSASTPTTDSNGNYVPPSVLTNILEKYSKDNVTTTGDCSDTDFECVIAHDPSNESTTFETTLASQFDMITASDGLPLIFFKAQHTGTSEYSLRAVKCNNLDCSDSTINVPLENTQVASFKAGLGVDGNPIVAYSTGSLGIDNSLIVMKCSDASCAHSVSNSTVDDTTDLHISAIDMAIGTDGFPIIVYQGSNPTILGDVSMYVIKCSTSDCSGSVTKTTLLSTTDYDYSNYGVEIGSDGYPLILAHESGAINSFRFVKCNDFACAGSDESVTIAPFSFASPTDTDFKIGLDGYPIVAQKSSNNLVVTKCNDAVCTGSDETETTVDNSANTVGGHTSIAFGTDGNPVISYYDDTDDNLKFAQCSNASCSSSTVTTVHAGATTYSDITFVGYTETNNNGNGTEPAGIAEGDLMLASVNNDQSTLTPPSGWTKLGSTIGPAPPYSTYTELYYIFRGSSAPALQWTGSHNFPIVTIVGYRNVDSIGDVATGTQESEVSPSVNATNDVDELVSVYVDAEYYASDPPTGMTKRTTTRVGDQHHENASSFADEELSSSGSTGTRTWQAADPQLDPVGTFSLILQPEVSGGAIVGLYSSIAIGPDGRPIIAYFDDTDDVIRVAKEVGLPKVASGYFDNNSGAFHHKQFDHSVAVTDSQYAYEYPSLKDGLLFNLDQAGYSALRGDDSSLDQITSGASQTPMYVFKDKYDDNSSHPAVFLTTQSTVAASTNNIKLDIYRFGSTNAWETIETNSTCSADTDCFFDIDIDEFAGSASDYYFYRPEYDASNNTVLDAYWTYWRLHQAEGSQTLKVDQWNPKSETIDIEGVNFEGINFF